MSMIFLTIIILIIAAIGGYYYLYQNNGKNLDDVLSSKSSEDRINVKDTKRKIDDLFNIEQRKIQEEVDRILDKINRKDLASLTKSEKEFLDKNAKS